VTVPAAGYVVTGVGSDVVVWGSRAVLLGEGLVMSECELGWLGVREYREPEPGLPEDPL